MEGLVVPRVMLGKQRNKFVCIDLFVLIYQCWMVLQMGGYVLYTGELQI